VLSRTVSPEAEGLEAPSDTADIAMREAVLDAGGKLQLEPVECLLSCCLSRLSEMRNEIARSKCNHVQIDPKSWSKSYSTKLGQPDMGRSSSDQVSGVITPYLQTKFGAITRRAATYEVFSRCVIELCEVQVIGTGQSCY
jgi:hypothetical protein